MTVAPFAQTRLKRPAGRTGCGGEAELGGVAKAAGRGVSLSSVCLDALGG